MTTESTKPVRDTRPMTIRNLAAYWQMPVEDLLDLPLTVSVWDGHRNREMDRSDMHFPKVSLVRPGATGQPGELRVDAYLSEHRMVRVSKKGAQS